jgi:gliding motility-associated-like protein
LNGTSAYINGGPNFACPWDWWNFNSGTTNPVTIGQTTAACGINIAPGDCYNWVLAGLYFRTTTCTTCPVPTNALTITPSTQATSCGNCNGSASVTVSGGSPPYTYNWNTVPPQTTQTATGLCAGTYTVTVTSNGGCSTATTTVTIPTSNGITFGPTTQSNVSCNNNCNAQATVNPTGSTPPYTYNWNTVPPQTTQTATGLCAGTYTVTVTSSTGCTATTTVTITQPPALSATTTQTNILCNAQCNGQASVTVSGGTPTYQYNWQPSGGNASTATGLCAGSYTVTITDANGCTMQQAFNITQPPALAINPSQVNVACNSQCTGTATATVTGGVPAYTYNWLPSGGNASTATGLCIGTYTVTVTDANGCTITQSYNITQPPALTLTPSSTNVSCFNQCNGTASVTAGGGNPPYNYNWQPSGGSNSSASSLCNGTYTVTVTDVNGCTATQSFTITQPTQLTAQTQGFADPCFQSCAGQGVTIPNGGTPPYQYNWTPSGGTNPAATGLCAGNYTITITDANGCTLQDTANVTQPAQLVLNTTPTNSLCVPNNASICASASGGTPTYTYTWQPSGSGTCISGLSSGTFTVTVTDFNNCTTTAIVSVISPTQALAVSTNTPAAICQGQLSSISSTATGGTPGYNYLWQPGGQNTSSINVTPSTSTVYSITVTDANNCTVTATVNLTVNPLPNVTFTTPDSGCAPVCVTFTNTTPNTQSVTWNFGDGNNSSTNPSVQHCYPNAGSYNVSLTVTDINGCSNSVTMNSYVNVFANPTACFSANPMVTNISNPTINFNDCSTAQVSIWNWNFSFTTSGQQNPVITFPDTGSYVVQLIVETPNGCRDTIYQTVIVQGEFTIYVPNAFTPNGDNLNDGFLAQGVGIDPNSFELWIFDRWGNMIYYTQSPLKPWDGHANGGKQIAQQDVYVWKINCKDIWGGKHNLIGHVSLIK